MPLSSRWHSITESSYPWEQDALDFVRERLPDQEPYHAWSNFEFIADQGSVNEVDLLVLAPGGFFLVEIKSRPGVLEGDAHTWIWRDQGRETLSDNPLLLTNRKAKRLMSLLRQQRAVSRMRLSARLGTMDDFLAQLERVEEEMTRPEDAVPANPAEARAGDVLPGGYKIRKRVGQGSVSVVFLVEAKDGRELVLKIASTPDQNDRIGQEGAVLGELRHQHIVAIHDVPDVGDHAALLMDRAGGVRQSGCPCSSIARPNPVGSDRASGAVGGRGSP